jgi:hypothetical protein
VVDWEAKVRDLRRIVNELEMLAQHLDGRHRMLLGRSADELKLFAADIEHLLHNPGVETPHEPLPEWLNEEVYPPSDQDSLYE